MDSHKIGYFYDPEMVLHWRYEGNYVKTNYDEIPEWVVVIDQIVWENGLYDKLITAAIPIATDE